MTKPRTFDGAGMLLPLGGAVIAMVVGQVWVILSPLLIALVVGVVAANLLPQPVLTRWFSDEAAKNMLRAGIVLLGFRLSLSHLAEMGLAGLVMVIATVLATYLSTLWLGRRLGLPEDLTQLIAAGFSICGAAAIAVVQDGVRATQRHVAVALTLVTIFGTAMIAIIPLASSALGLDERQGGMWAGASIHEVAQVVAAGSLIGSTAVTAAITVKLGRVLMLAPVHMLAIRTSRTQGLDIPLIPWFVLGFLGAVLARTFVPLPAAALSLLDTGATTLLAAGMCGLGAAIVFKDLWPLPWRSLVLATGATAVATLVPLGLVVIW